MQCICKISFCVGRHISFALKKIGSILSKVFANVLSEIRPYKVNQLKKDHGLLFFGSIESVPRLIWTLSGLEYLI